MGQVYQVIEPLFYERPTYDVRSKRSDVRCVLKRAEPLLLNLSASALLMRDSDEPLPHS